MIKRLVAILMVLSIFTLSAGCIVRPARPVHVRVKPHKVIVVKPLKPVVVVPR
jgi:hypothetical protein